jgi:hypothetical protein
MNRTLFCFLALASLVYFACQPLERPNVPVLHGLRLEMPPNNLSDCAEKLKNDFTARELSVELMVVADSGTGLPKISRTSLVEVSRLILGLQRYGFSYTIQLHHSNFRPLFFPDQKINAETWFTAYEKEIREELLPRLASAKVNRLSLGTYYEPIESETKHWQALFQSVRRVTKIPLLYVASVERAGQIRFWQSCDEIGIFYQTSIEQNDKVYARKWNEKLSALALKEKKPLFIAQANLIGENKQIQLENRLRFWDENVSLNGLVVNNIFPIPAVCDTNAYFGLGQDAELLEYLRDYAGR